MPLISLSITNMLILLFILSPAIQVAGALIGRKIPLSHLTPDKWLYRSRKWENNGKIYRKVFKIHKWKNLLPDGAKFFKGDFEKKRLMSSDSEYLRTFVRESCRAELVHWIGMIPFAVFFLLVPPLVASIMVVYSILVNMPCIIAQRYNRPRLVALLKIQNDKMNS